MIIMIENSNEALDLRQYPAFQRKESYEAFVKHIQDACDALDNGTAKLIPSETVWAELDRKIENARIQDRFSGKRAKGA